MIYANKQKGSIMLVTVFIVIILALLSASYLTLGFHTYKESQTKWIGQRAMQLAEAGLDVTLASINNGDCGVLKDPQMVEVAGGQYYVTSPTQNIDADGNDKIDDDVSQLTIQATGTYKDVQRTVEIMMKRENRHPFMYALFAGDSIEAAKHPSLRTYDLDFSGNGDLGDIVIGDVYSGNDIVAEGDSFLDGNLEAGGDINVPDGNQSDSGKQKEGIQRNGYNLDLLKGDNLAARTDVVYVNDQFGPNQVILPEDDMCHIFAKNPPDRMEDVQYFQGNVDPNNVVDSDAAGIDNFFLEDPYIMYKQNQVDGFYFFDNPYVFDDPYTGVREGPRRERVRVGNTSLTEINFTGSPGNPEEEDTNHKIFYIQGNLYLHSYDTYGFKPQHYEKNGTAVTFLVEGNIYFCDNIYYRNYNRGFIKGDMYSFIAVKRSDDPSGTMSGNFFIGDPEFGTIERIESLLFAENDFIDNNIYADRSRDFEIFGTMGANNQVNINRNHGTIHSKMTLESDRRVWADTFQHNIPPGVLDMIGTDEENPFEIVIYRTIDPDTQQQ